MAGLIEMKDWRVRKFGRKPEDKRPLRRSRQRWQHKDKTYLKELGIVLPSEYAAGKMVIKKHSIITGYSSVTSGK